MDLWLTFTSVCDPSWNFLSWLSCEFQSQLFDWKDFRDLNDVLDSIDIVQSSLVSIVYYKALIRVKTNERDVMESLWSSWMEIGQYYYHPHAMSAAFGVDNWLQELNSFQTNWSVGGDLISRQHWISISIRMAESGRCWETDRLDWRAKKEDGLDWAKTIRLRLTSKSHFFGLFIDTGQMRVRRDPAKRIFKKEPALRRRVGRQDLKLKKEMTLGHFS